MVEMPAPVFAYLNRLATEQRSPAFLLTDDQARLSDWGGNLAEYGISDLQAGQLVGEQIYFLEGLLPLQGNSIILPCLQTDSGRVADLHLFPTEAGDCALLLDATLEEFQQRLMQQKGNEASLNYQRLAKEIQKKEILLHCIVHDLAGPLMGIRGGYELLASEPISEQGRKFLEIGLRQAAKQETLIREILSAFSAEVESLNEFSVDADNAPDVGRAVRDVGEALSAAFAHSQVKLRLDLELGKDWKVVGDKSRLERVISNLLENALRYSPANSTITIGCHDEGAGIPPEVAPTLFQKFAQGKKGKGKIGLGLYFCRITVEHWKGEIGHAPRETGGTRFWFRLPRPQNVEGTIK
jgi:signal transduction histidine kinase